eukprot:GHUV01032028.1.p1 GENE.GHUV01032028.1~~GHUV01032028.1.p1  ORF type:complete len:247 (+),score=39.29 GHUV01032028.1:313-1053(+)
MLSLIEVVSLLLILLLLTHRSPGPYTCHFDSCLDDAVLFGGLQAAVLSGTYAWGSSSNRLRPYLISSYIVGVSGFIFALVKALYYKYTSLWIPAAAIMANLAFFSCLQILAARNTVAWARRRASLGLAPLEALGTIRFSRFSTSAGTLADIADSAAVIDIRQPLFNGRSSSEDPATATISRRVLVAPNSQLMVDERLLGTDIEGQDRLPALHQPAVGSAGQQSLDSSTRQNGSSEIGVAVPHQDSG